MCCSILRCVAVCCGVLRCVEWHFLQCVVMLRLGLYPHAQQCVKLGCSILQCIAVRDSVAARAVSAEIQHFIDKQNAFET